MILAFVPILLFAQSQSPSPTLGKSTQGHQSKPNGKEAKATEDQQVSDAPSAAINQRDTEMATREKKESAPTQENHSSSDWWIMWSAIVSAVATIAIAYLGYRQWRTLQGHHKTMDEQVGVINNVLAETKKSADAAAKSAVVAEGALHSSQ